MEEVYVNFEYDKSVEPRPSTNPTGPLTSQRGFRVAVGLGTVVILILMAGLIGYAAHTLKSAQNISARIHADVNTRLTAMREQLNASLIETMKKLNKKSCPAGWRWFYCSCYLLSEESGSWEKGRQDCRDRGADLVVISSPAEQLFLTRYTEEETQAWIGLTDRVTEKTWMWIDGAPLSQKYWQGTQPDNGGGYGELGEEDCAHIRTGVMKLTNWNDLSCDTSLRWFCEKMV